MSDDKKKKVADVLADISKRASAAIESEKKSYKGRGKKPPKDYIEDIDPKNADKHLED